MPVPGGCLEPEVLARREIAAVRADKANGEEDRADDDVKAMEAGRHEECRAVDVAFERERRVRIFPRLDAGKQKSEQNRQQQPELQAMAATVDQRVMPSRPAR